MKNILLFAMLVMSFSAFAEILGVNKMSIKPGFNTRYDLRVHLPEVKADLDCQSFIQGLNIEKNHEKIQIVLEAWECEEISKKMYASLKKLKAFCIDVDYDSLTIKDSSTCR
jgi:hypothetical protein